jgi:hypothetical protein
VTTDIANHSISISPNSYKLKACRTGVNKL